MIKGIWIFIIFFVALMVEIICGTWGIIFPGSMFLCFYLVVSFNVVIGSILGIAACFITEVVLGRPTTAFPLLLPIILFAAFWRDIGDRRFLITQVVVGALIGLIYYVYCLFTENIHFPVLIHSDLSAFILNTIITIIVSAVGFPILVYFFDMASSTIDVGVFRTRNTVHSKANENRPNF